MESSENIKKESPTHEIFDAKEHTFSCPCCGNQFKLEPQELRTLAGILMGSSTSKRKSETSRENGRKGGQYKPGIIAPATASRLVSAKKAVYGEYISGQDLLSFWEKHYGAYFKDIREADPDWNPNRRYRIVIRKDIEGRIDIYNVDYYKDRLLKK